MFTRRRWWYWHKRIFKFILVLLFVVVFVGEFGCFWWAFHTWRIPITSRDSLNLLLLSDSQIQGYKGERPGIVGSIARFDSDWYLKKAFFLALTSFHPDAVIHLGDILDEGYIATDDEFQEYKIRHDNIFHTPKEISRNHIAGDNDIGGEWTDVITEEKVSRFSQNFGSINDVIKIKSYQIVKINLLSFLRKRPFKDEQAVYNSTIAFIDGLPSKLDKDKIPILIGHIPLGLVNKNQHVQLSKAAAFEHKFGSVTFTEYIVPTCSYRMGTVKMGAVVAVLGIDGSIDYSVLALPPRYPFFYAYLTILGICTVILALPWLIICTVFITNKASRVINNNYNNNKNLFIHDSNKNFTLRGRVSNY